MEGIKVGETYLYIDHPEYFVKVIEVTQQLMVVVQEYDINGKIDFDNMIIRYSTFKEYYRLMGKLEKIGRGILF